MSARQWLVAGLLSAVLASGALGAEERGIEQFWMQYNTSFLDTGKFGEALAMLDTAKDAGVTHMVLNEQSMHRWDLMDRAYLAKIAEFRAAAAEHGITIVPNIFPIGYGIRYLVHDVNLAAGLPVKDAPFVARGGLATPDPTAVPSLVNAGFDEADGNALKGWQQEHAGTFSFVDTEVKRSGGASLKVAAGPEGPRGMRVTQTVAVQPFKYYRLSAWVKTQGARDEAESFFEVWSHDRKRRNTYYNVAIKGTQDWTRHYVVFNTLDADSVEIMIGPRNLRSGTLWLDDVTVEPAGILNVVRRDMTPLTVTSADGAVAYEEGRDFERVFDPLFVYDELASIDHAPAPIRLAPDTRIREGQKLLVSYYHAMRIYIDQVVLSISDPLLYEYMEKQMEHVAKVWPSTHYFMSADEIRIAGWELQPDGENLTVARMLSRYMERSYEMVARNVPGARIVVWSDMFTPFHNGRPLEERGPYYLCTGGFYGSWNTLPSDVIIANWHSRSRLNPVWFEVRGHEQILCGYYDTSDLKANIAHWMNVTENVEGIKGMMYTQWSTGHEKMKEFFQLTRDYPAWLEADAAERGVTRER